VLAERILRNLISNAIRYTEKGKITISSYKEGSTIIVKVSDTGIGIPQDQQEQIFSEYHQLNNPERDREKGLGLGLAIVKRLTDLLDLEISLESKMGTGSTFSIHFPAGNASKAKTVVSFDKPWDLTGTKVLVIDDEVDILRGMEEILSDWGCNMILASSAEEALSTIRKQSFEPDLILSDYRLRDHKTGAEAIAEIERYRGN